MLSNELQGNLELFRDCLSGPLVQKFAVDHTTSSSKSKPKRRKRAPRDVEYESGTTATGSAAEELGDFIDVWDLNRLTELTTAEGD